MKKIQIISRKALFFGAFILLINGMSALNAESLAERGRQAIRTKLTQARSKANALLKALDGYKQCMVQGTCTKAQKNNLRILAAATATAVIALAALSLAGFAAYGGKDKEGVGTPGGAVIEDGEGSITPSLKLNLQFLQAVMLKDVAEAEKFLKEGAQIGFMDGRDRTAIDIAIEQRDRPMITMLRKYELPSMLDLKFLQAVMLKDVGQAQTFLKSGAQIQAKDGKGRTAMDIAIEQRDMPMMKMLQQYE